MRAQEFIVEVRSPAEISELEDQLDHMFQPLGLDVEFTRHFVERLLGREKKVTADEIRDSFQKLKSKYKRQLLKSKKENPGDRKALLDFDQDLNILFSIVPDRKDNEYDLVNITVKRKDPDEFHTDTPSGKATPFKVGTKKVKESNVIRETEILSKEVWEGLLDAHWRLEELTPKEMRWWKKAYLQDKKSVLEVLDFLDALASRFAGSPQHIIEGKKLSRKAHTFITNFSGHRQYKYLYRGMELNNESDIKGLSVGDPLVYNSKYLSFWSQKPSWASVFVQWWGYVLKIQPSQNDILLDMNLIPYGIGPDGNKEPEVILKPKRYKTVIHQLFNNKGPI